MESWKNEENREAGEEMGMGRDKCCPIGLAWLDQSLRTSQTLSPTKGPHRRATAPLLPTAHDGITLPGSMPLAR